MPVPVVALESLPGRLVGVCLGPVVVVRRDFLDDRPTIIHELTHCRQFWRGLTLLHLLRYYVSRRYRLESELEAFRAEIDACRGAEKGRRLLESSRALATSYGLDLDVATCHALLSSVDRDTGRRSAGIGSDGQSARELMGPDRRSSVAARVAIAGSRTATGSVRRPER